MWVASLSQKGQGCPALALLFKILNLLDKPLNNTD
jgi:hypothetical protein